MSQRSINNTNKFLTNNIIGTLSLTSNDGQSQTDLSNDNNGDLHIKPNTSTSSINIGYVVADGGSGENSIAIGALSGFSPGSSQPDNQICINASGSSLYSSQTDACFINPIRNDNTQTDMLGYNTTTKEIVYNPASGMTVQVFTSSDTWTKPSGCLSVKVIVVGAGGGGGGSDADAQGEAGIGAGGGGGGSVSVGWLDVTSISSSTITVGSGGSGGNDANGSAGGNSSWDDGTNTLTGNGGSGGSTKNGTTSWDSATGAAGGAASGGDINVSGQVGGDAWSGGSGYNTGTRAMSGGDGSTYLSIGVGGPGRRIIYVNAAGWDLTYNGHDAIGYGGGGDGSASVGTVAAGTGGDGGAGIVIVEEYYF